MADNTREIVLDMLLEEEKGEAYSHKLVFDVLTKYDYLTAQEKAFIKRVFEGTIERRIELDYEINHVASVPVKKMKPLIRSLLRMSAYQIFFMDGVPNAAAVNEAVKLAQKRKFVSLKGFVNGVLRKLSTMGEPVLPLKEKEPKAFLSVAFSMPEWIVEHFLNLYSYAETEALLAALLEVRPVTIRFAGKLAAGERETLIRRLCEKGCRIWPHPYVKQAYYLENCDNITRLPGFQEGKFTVQDASSMLAVAAADIRQGDTVLDICASPGGKTLLAAEYAGADGSVKARDITEGKVAKIAENVERMKLGNVSTEVWDAAVFDEGAVKSADVVLADVPCSGLGVMGKKRDIKYRQSKEAVAELNALQKAIVRQAAAYVKTGGILLYSTCTINPVENEEMVDFICREMDFSPESIEAYLPDMQGKETAKQGYIQLLPQIHDTDGFFFARLRKKDNVKR